MLLGDSDFFCLAFYVVFSQIDANTVVGKPKIFNIQRAQLRVNRYLFKHLAEQKMKLAKLVSETYINIHSLLSM